MKPGGIDFAVLRQRIRWNKATKQHHEENSSQTVTQRTLAHSGICITQNLLGAKFNPFVYRWLRFLELEKLTPSGTKNAKAHIKRRGIG